MYSDEYIPGGPLNEDNMKDVFEKRSNENNKSFMGIWQMFGLASVLQMTVLSVHPARGNPHVREGPTAQAHTAQGEVSRWRGAHQVVINEARHGRFTLDSKPFCAGSAPEADSFVCFIA